MRLTILSGPRGQGKTSRLCEYAAAMADRGRTVGGIASPAVYENDRRIGYDLLDLRSGSRRRLSRIAAEPGSSPTVGVFQFDDAAINAGNRAIVSALRDGVDVLAIDEVGPLELDGGGWAPGVRLALQSHETPGELILVVRPSLLEVLPECFPSLAWATAARLFPPWMDLLHE